MYSFYKSFIYFIFYIYTDILSIISKTVLYLQFLCAQNWDKDIKVL